jgi:BTB/POZ domain
MSLTCDYIDFGAPFDHLDADLILRSAPVPNPASVGTLGDEDRSIATDFRVHKLFLIKASPVFERLLCESSSSNSNNDSEAADLGITRDDNDNNWYRDRDRDLPVLRLTEDRDTVHRLLTAIYPTDVVYPQTLEVMMRTFAAARKYGMSSVLALFRTYCDRVARIVTTDNAFRAYLFAFGEGLCEEALEAARLTLSQPQTFESYGEDLRQASGPALRALWRHRQLAFVAIGFGVQDCLVEVGDLRGWKATSCSLRVGDKSCCTEMGTRPLEQFMLYTRKITSNFAMMNFPSFVEVMSSQGGFKCASCKGPIRLNLLRLFNCLERHVNGDFSRASPPLCFLQSVHEC